MVLPSLGTRPNTTAAWCLYLGTADGWSAGNRPRHPGTAVSDFNGWRQRPRSSPPALQRCSGLSDVRQSAHEVRFVGDARAHYPHNAMLRSSSICMENAT